MITLSLPRRGACNLAILCPCVRPAAVALCLRSRNAILPSVLLVQFARPGKHFDQLRCCVCFRVSLLACSAPWLSGVRSDLKPGFLQIACSRIRRRVHDIVKSRKLVKAFGLTFSKTCADIVNFIERNTFGSRTRHLNLIRKLAFVP